MRNKPRILKGWGGEWWCVTWPEAPLGECMGLGTTIKDAYDNWKKKNNK